LFDGYIVFFTYGASWRVDAQPGSSTLSAQKSIPSQSWHNPALKRRKAVCLGPAHPSAVDRLLAMPCKETKQNTSNTTKKGTAGGLLPWLKWCNAGSTITFGGRLGRSKSERSWCGPHRPPPFCTSHTTHDVASMFSLDLSASALST
jgi:hypothetical protein